MEKKKRRLFVAVSLPEDALSKIEQFQNEMKPFARDAKWVNVYGAHISLKFLGYVQEEQISAIETTLGTIASGLESFAVTLCGCGFFPSARRPSVFWIGVQSDKMLELQKQVEDAMAALGFEKENRPFSPHLTLARFRDPRGRLALVNEVEKHKNKEFASYVSDHFTLYESILRPEGAEYKAVRRFDLEQVP